MSILAQSFDDPQRLNQRAYSLYCDFRPDSGGGWGVRKEMKLASILNLREGSKRTEPAQVILVKKEEDLPAKTGPETDGASGEPESKRRKLDETQNPEVVEAAGEEDFTLWDLYDEDG